MHLRAAAKTLLPTISFIVPRLALDSTLVERPRGVDFRSDLTCSRRPSSWTITSLPGVKGSICFLMANIGTGKGQSKEVPERGDGISV